MSNVFVQEPSAEHDDFDQRRKSPWRETWQLVVAFLILALA